MEILISVIVPIYNVEEYLEKCLDSISSQTYSNLDIILIDDGSVDGSQIICENYKKKDNRVRVVHQENAGVMNARKTGLKIARGEYVCFVDADDWIDDDYLANMIDQIDESNADMACAPIYYRDYENGYEELAGPIITSFIGIKQNNNYELLDKLKYVTIKEDVYWFAASMCSWLIRAELANEVLFYVDDEIKWAEDVCFIFLCLLNCKKIMLTDKCGYHYRLRQGSALQSLNTVDSLKKIYEVITSYIEKGIHNTELVKQYLVQLIINLTLFSHYELFMDDRGYLFPYPQIVNGSKVVIYGAGALGQKIVKALKLNSKIKLVAWIDQRYQSFQKNGGEVSAPTILSDISFDYIIIAVSHTTMRNAIIEKLSEMGIPLNKIARKDEKLYKLDSLPDCIVSHRFRSEEGVQ